MNLSHDTLEPKHREIAIRRCVQLRAEFLRHFAMYLAVIATLWLTNLWVIREGGMMRPEKWWAFIPTVAWGFGILTHGVSVALSSFTRAPWVSVDWEERRVQQLMHESDSEREAAKS
jgi:two-component system, LytTR family, sensor kinase